MKKYLMFLICLSLLMIPSISGALDLEAFRIDLDRCLEEASKKADKELGVDKYLMEMDLLNKMEIHAIFNNDRFMIERIRLRSEAIRKLVDGELAESMDAWRK